jgi:S1-C subfamily serine protease
VAIRQQNELLLSTGLKQGDVIVAINGVRVHTFEQYGNIRESLDTPDLDLIVWQGNAYHEIKASPPNHRFGVDFGDYKPN